MDIDDLLRALKGANVTINIQDGQGNTMYTAPVQNNTYNRRGSSRRAVKAPSTCNICGKIAGGRDIFYHFIGWSHQECLDKRRKDNLKKYDRSWQIVKSIPDELPDTEAPLQLPAPPHQQTAGFDLQAHLAELDEQYAESDRQMTENGRKFREEEDRYFASISPHANRAAELLTPQEQSAIELMCYYADHLTE